MSRTMIGPGRAGWCVCLMIAAGCANDPPAGPTPAATTAEPAPSAPSAPVPPPPPAPPSAAAAPEVVPANSARPVHWGYAAEVGPTHWAHLSPAYAACGNGQAQSPIDIPAGSAAKPASFSLKYGKSSLRVAHHEHVHDITDNGHTIQVTVDEGSTLETARGTYSLLQFHFHTPSENTVGGKHYPMEIHFVHKAADGRFGVVAGFFEEGPDNPRLAQLIQHLPAKGAVNELREEVLDLRMHLPEHSGAYTFMGSFTTPPCTEDVEWVVLSKPIHASKDQLAAFAARLQQNNRPIQSLNERAVSLVQLDGKRSK
jgi:carbonic anhydrase